MRQSTPPISANLCDIPVGDAAPVRIMAIVNVSPESFYNKSVSQNLEQIAETAHMFVTEGADIIDVGAMSTAPYNKTQISSAEETDRLVRSIDAIKKKVSVPVSADTTRAVPAKAALNSGAQIINDVTGLKNDPEMATVIADAAASVVLVANDGSLKSDAPSEGIANALWESLEIAGLAGIPKRRIVIDPGIGFFRGPGIRWPEWDYRAIREIDRLRPLGLPILVGASRKSFIGEVLKQPNPADRLIGSLGCAALAAEKGAHILRTHDPKETLEIVKIVEAIQGRTRTST